MESKRKRNECVGKKPYTKPEIKQVELKPEEAVLGICKQASQGGPGGTCSPVPCSDIGS